MSEFDKRKAKMMVSKSGGTAGRGSVTFRATLPTSWVRDMGLGAYESERDLDLIYDAENKTITLRKEIVYCIKCDREANLESIAENDEDKITSKYYKCTECETYFKRVFKGHRNKLVEEVEVDKSEVIFI